MIWDTNDILFEKEIGERKKVRIVATNKSLLTLQFCNCTVQHLLDIRLNKETRRFHAKITQFIVNDSLEVVLPVLCVIDLSSDQNRARTKNNLAVTDTQLPGKTLNVLEANHQTEKLIQRRSRCTSVENTTMAAHFLPIRHN